MSLVKTIELLQAAQARGHGLGAFNVIGLEHAQAIVRAAEMERSPVILQISQNAIRYNLDDIGPIGIACREIAQRSPVPVALHLDHATTRELCERAVDLGFGSVMLDVSTLDYEQNLEQTAELARWIHEWGCGLEAELGLVGGKNGIESSHEGNTDPNQACKYVDETGVDALAVAVGTTHYMIEKAARIDLDLITRIRERVSVPLVLHGSSGVPDNDLSEAIRRGIVKVNIATLLNKAFTSAVREHLERDTHVVDPRRYLSEARDAMVEVVRDRIQLLGSSGRA